MGDGGGEGGLDAGPEAGGEGRVGTGRLGERAELVEGVVRHGRPSSFDSSAW